MITINHDERNLKYCNLSFLKTQLKGRISSRSTYSYQTDKKIWITMMITPPATTLVKYICYRLRHKLSSVRLSKLNKVLEGKPEESMASKASKMITVMVTDPSWQSTNAVDWVISYFPPSVFSLRFWWVMVCEEQSLLLTVATQQCCLNIFLLYTMNPTT